MLSSEIVNPIIKLLYRSRNSIEEIQLLTVTLSLVESLPFHRKLSRAYSCYNMGRVSPELNIGHLNRLNLTYFHQKIVGVALLNMFG